MAVAGVDAAIPTTRRRRAPSLQVFPFFHIGGLSGLYVTTGVGNKLVTMYKWDVDVAIDLLVRERDHEHVDGADRAAPAARVAAARRAAARRARRHRVRRGAGAARSDPRDRDAVRVEGRRRPTATA